MFLHYFRDGPRWANTALSDINAMEHVVACLSRFISGDSAIPEPRAAILQVDWILATVTDAVLIFTELEPLLVPGKLAWAYREEKIVKLLRRVQWHESTFSLIFNIFQWYARCPRLWLR